MRTRGRPFAKGRSANPKGRPKGSRSKATVALETILAGDAQAIVRKATEMALAGDATALQLCLDRLIPVRRDRPVVFALPAIEGPADLSKATGALLQAVSTGALTPSEAGELSKAVETHLRALQATDLDARLAAVEAKFPNSRR